MRRSPRFLRTTPSSSSSLLQTDLSPISKPYSPRPLNHRKKTDTPPKKKMLKENDSDPTADSSPPVYFWRESHPETGYLSQLWPCAFRDPKDREKIYKTAEHYMMHHKALLFNDTSIAHTILSTPHPRAVKALGRKIKGFDEDTWLANRERIVEEGTWAKFTCVVEESETNLRRGTMKGAPLFGDGAGMAGLKRALLDTGDRELVEASPYDAIWGIGLTERDADEVDRAEWGLNLLGKALMRVRDRLRGDMEGTRIEGNN